MNCVPYNSHTITKVYGFEFFSSDASLCITITLSSFKATRKTSLSPQQTLLFLENDRVSKWHYWAASNHPPFVRWATRKNIWPLHQKGLKLHSHFYAKNDWAWGSSRQKLWWAGWNSWKTTFASVDRISLENSCPIDWQSEIQLFATRAIQE